MEEDQKIYIEIKQKQHIIEQIKSIMYTTSSYLADRSDVFNEADSYSKEDLLELNDLIEEIKRDMSVINKFIEKDVTQTL